MEGRSFCLFVLATLFALGFSKAIPHPDDLEAEIDGLIKRNPLMVFSKTYCPFSKRAKKLLGETYGLKKMHVMEVDEREDMDRIQDYLQTLSGVHTVPQVFIDGKFIGGAMDLEEMDRKKKLRPMLQKAKLL